MSREKKDKSFNKDCISQAICDLLKKKKLADIKVEDIVKVSGLSRITYFRHFDSKYDAIAYKLSRDYEPYRVKSSTGNVFNYDSTLQLLRFHYSYKDSIYEHLTDQEFNCLMVVYCASQFKDTNFIGEDEFRLNIIIYSFIGVMSLWKNHHFTETPEMVCKYLQGILK